MEAARLISFDRSDPQVHASAWVAPGAILIGDVRLDADASVWYGAVVRADGDLILVGARSNVQDGCVIHADPGLAVIIGAYVSVGHRAVLHGCRIGDGSLIGIGAAVLNNADVGPGCLIAAGTVVLEGSVIPAGSLVVGTPGRVRRALSEAEQQDLLENAKNYVQLATRHSLAGGPREP
jgi:carbonic anhydrase/acetyltransferase-like protein (isoleucine patch superfamily)